MAETDDEALRDDVLSQLDDEQREIMSELIDDVELPPFGELRDEIAFYMLRIRREAETNDTIDLDLAEDIGDAVRGLVDYFAIEPDDVAYRLVTAAVHYFVMDDDAEDDFASPIGFDDDAEVVSAVARALALPEFIVEL